MPKGNHEGELTTFFYNLTTLGAVTVRASVLMFWTGWEKQFPGFWAELRDRYNAALQPGEIEDGWRLLRWQHEEHITLVAMDPKNAAEEDLWWRDVSDLAAAPPPGRRKKAE